MRLNKRQTSIAAKLIKLFPVFCCTGLLYPQIAIGAPLNPFTDVPKDHWSYSSVTELAQDGVIEGYGDGSFCGGKNLTRYEMAQMIAKAMANNSNNGDARGKIDKLAAEYAAELQKLGVGVDNLDRAADAVAITGLARLRTDNGDVRPTKAAASTGHQSDSHAHIELWTRGKVNDQWTAIMQSESQFNMATGKTNSNGLKLNKVYVEGPLFGATARLGKFGALSSYGRIIDTEISGAELTYNWPLETKFVYGKLNSDRTLSDAHFFTSNGDYSARADTGYTALQLGYALSPATRVGATYARLNRVSSNLDGMDTGIHDAVRFWELGFNTKLSSDWSWMAAYSSSNLRGMPDAANAEIANGGGFSELRYKSTDLNRPGTYAVFLNYRNVGAFAGIDGIVDFTENVRGWTLGFDYIPARNMQMELFYIKGTQVNATNANGRKDADIFRAELIFNF